ncbi:alpha/beta fold hydrolase [Pontibacter sp. G13]|uniref:alpha/beta fold hydrolase n=1 Tax=Pontibacter sp. G13 TaxID=3074898 RepID=UPI002889806F|nr:alpha/beta fold hydrolase [Pontibacter sp. G13]WNJ17042.1 alpha/beta fold hydrolase [Pontibacter sp. G13]
MSLTVQAQSWVDSSRYPFQHRFIELEAGTMHYVDEGSGETLLFLHGTPTWSFLYREFIASLSQSNRCIAVDHLGFGLSEHPASFDGRPESHSQNLAEFIEKLDLQEITLVVHDFGGPIGLGAALQHRDRIKRIVLFNTWLWETKHDAGAQKIDKIVHSGLGKFMYLRMNFSPKFLLKKGIYDKQNLPKEIHRQYVYPFPDKSSRQSLLQIGQSLVGSSDWYQAQWEQLDQLASLPWLILWGTKDEFITVDYLRKWRDRLPDARVKEFECGHFIQEEKAAEAIREMEAFMAL